MADVSIRLMKDEDIKPIMEWTREEHLSITEFDLGVFRACHPQDFFVAEVEGKPVGTIAAVRNNDDTGILGNFIVSKEFRGTGIGRKLLEKAKDRLDLSETRHVCLNSIGHAAPLYTKHGFTKLAFDVHVCTGEINVAEMKKFACEGIKLIRITGDNLPLLVKYACKVLTTSDLSKYFEMFVENKDVVACVAVQIATNSDDNDDEDLVVGIGMAVPANPGFHYGSVIQPLYADSPEIAGLIVKFLYENQPLMAKGVMMKGLGSSINGMKLISQLGLHVLRRLKRQYSGPDYDIPTDKVYTIRNVDVSLY